MKIGEIAKLTHTPVETIRHYEREGLLAAPARTAGNYRAYNDEHVQRLGFIRHCRCLDMTLAEIRVLLRYRDDPAADCEGVDRQLDEHIQHVTMRIRELNALKKELTALRSACTGHRPSNECGILQGLERAAREHEHATGSHAARHVAGTH